MFLLIFWSYPLSQRGEFIPVFTMRISGGLRFSIQVYKTLLLPTRLAPRMFQCFLMILLPFSYLSQFPLSVPTPFCLLCHCSHNSLLDCDSCTHCSSSFRISGMPGDLNALTDIRNKHRFSVLSALLSSSKDRGDDSQVLYIF